MRAPEPGSSVRGASKSACGEERCTELGELLVVHGGEFTERLARDDSGCSRLEDFEAVECIQNAGTHGKHAIIMDQSDRIVRAEYGSHRIGIQRGRSKGDRDRLSDQNITFWNRL